MTVKPRLPVYEILKEFQCSKDCESQDLYCVLHEFAGLFIREFRLEIPEFVIGIGSLRRNRLGQFRRGTNDLGLRAEILIADHHVLACTQSGEFWLVLGTLLHELLHGWQELHGNPGRRNYHNRQFRRRAMELGLIIDQRGCTEYDPGSPFFELLEQQGVEVPALPEPKLFREEPRPKSKLQLWVCLCDPPQRARIGRSKFEALCPNCNSYFEKA